jgi:hypothetical protein
VRGANAVLDACVLYPAPLRDLLLRLSIDGLYRAKWTERIHDEWIAAVLRNRPDLSSDQLERTRFLMDRAIPNALVSGYERHLRRIFLADGDDRHVVAAAIESDANIIVTSNISDFPPDAMARFDLEAVHPDDFVANLLAEDAAQIVASARECRARLRSPPLTASEYLDRLAACGLPKSVARLRSAAEVL